MKTLPPKPLPIHPTPRPTAAVNVQIKTCLLCENPVCFPHSEDSGASWAQFRQQEAVLKATAVRSPLPVMSPILRRPACFPQVMQARGGSRWQGVWVRGLGRGGGQGTFHPPCHVLHYHMVLRLKGLRTIRRPWFWNWSH